MPYVSKISLTLSVNSEILSPDMISTLAGLNPTDLHCKGDARGNGTVDHGFYQTNYWALRVRVDGTELETESTNWFSDGVMELLQQVPVDFVQRLKLDDPDVGAIVWIGLFDIRDQGAINIRSDVSKMLGERDLELVFDMYIDHSS